MITIAQIGVGYWGPNILRNLMLNPACRVKKVADLDAGRRDFVKRLYPGVEVAEDADEIWDDESIEAVVIATPVLTHYELTCKALKAGKHVLVEKPMATSVTEVHNIAALAGENDRVAMVGHTFLYNPSVRYLKQLVDAGDLGDIRYIYSQRLNLGRIRSDVNALWTLAPHDISVIQYLLGDPVPLVVSKQGMDYVQPSIQDVVFMTLIYPGKIMAHIHVSWLDPYKIRKMVVVGSKKMAVYDDISQNKIFLYNKGIDKMAVIGQDMDYDQPGFYGYNYRAGDVLLPKIPADEPLKVEIDHFFDCIQNKTKCLTGPDHAAKVVAILAQ